jgi:ankyrin repeat domain-containing protein 50
MDPLSVSASIIAVLELTVTLMKYVNDVRKAPTERVQLAREAGNIYGLLTSLRFRVEDAQNDDPWFNQVKLLANQHGALSQFHSVLEKLVTKLESSSKLKDLLWKFNKPEIDEALSRIERLKSLVHIALTNDMFTLTQSIKQDISVVAQNLDTLRLNQDSEWPPKLAKWLDVPDPSSNYAAACKRRQPGTGTWLLQDRRFLDWKSSTASCLWLHGIPGCGKTVLSATVIDHIRESTSAIIVYFYFDFNDVEKRDVAKCVRSLILQLASQSTQCLQDLKSLYIKCHDGQMQPQDAGLLALLNRLLQTLDKTYIIFDALDECNHYQALLDLIEGLNQSQPPGLHFLATSRRERELEERLRPLLTHDVPIQASSVDADINVYVQDLLKNDLRLRKWPLNVHNEIQQTIANKSHGM